MPTFTLDEIDLKILEILEADARLTNVELADKVGLSTSPCLRRVRRQGGIRPHRICGSEVGTAARS
jgi:DNA-binding Lrp family transcriptional regulator